MSASCNATSAQLNTCVGKQRTHLHTHLHTHDNSNQRTKHKQPQG